MDYAVTFDLWNTLIWERHHDQVANRLSANMGRVLTAAGYGIEKDQLSGIIEECRQMVMARQVKEGLDILPEEQLYWILGRVGLAPTGRVVKELLEYYTSVRDRGEILIMEGAEAVLEVLARKYRLALICNTGRTPGRVIRPWLAAAGLSKYLQVLTFSNELGIAKPNPDIFFQTLEKLGAVPERAAHIGDDPRTDVKGARSAGMVPIWFNSRQREDAPPEARQVQHLDRLAGLLKSIWDY
ncbi:MAG: HAD family hydrolase [Firmicutes bacterium]|nr:HAD family hydrolase [Bacillota bacterium]